MEEENDINKFLLEFKTAPNVQSEKKTDQSLEMAKDEADKGRMKKIGKIYKDERLKERVERIQESNMERIKKIKILVKNDTRKELFQMVLRMHQQFFEEGLVMKHEAEMKNQKVFVLKNTQEHLIGKFVEQNVVVRTFNAQSPLFAEVFDVRKLYSDVEELKEQIKAHTERLNVVKIVNAEYKKDAEDALNKVKNSDLVLEKLKFVHSKAIKRLQERFGKRENEVIEETQRIRTEFEVFKNKIGLELKIRTVLQERQNEFIEKLIEELKNIKIILQNPTLRIKTYQKLKQSMTPSDGEQMLPSVATVLMTDTKKSRDLLLSRSTHIKTRTRSGFRY